MPACQIFFLGCQCIWLPAWVSCNACGLPYNLSSGCVQALDSAQRRLAQLCIEKADVLQQAQAAGIGLDPDEAYVRLPTVLQTDDHLTYVKLLLESAFLDGISSNGGTYVAALTGGAAHGLLANAQSADHRRKLEARLERLEAKLSITLRWREHDDLFMVWCCQSRIRISLSTAHWLVSHAH